LNSVVHLELHTHDSAAARAFYSELLSWGSETLEVEDQSYLALDVGGAIGGGIVECGTPRPIWLPYVEVAHVEHATARATELGATVLLEPREGPAGWRSVVAVPNGAEIALWEHKR
jgi:predicted enzyme related to lactoylglutathione lyase